MFEFNKIYSSGQGMAGYRDLTSEFTVDNVQTALDQAALPFTPVNGSLQIQVFNKQTGLTKSTDIPIRLNGLGDDTTLQDLADQIDAIDGLAAQITPSRELRVFTESANLSFAFARDTSGAVAALGLATFFTGSSASDIGISRLVRDDPSMFAASSGGIGSDTQNAVLLAGFLDRPLEAQGGATIADMYDRLTGEVTQQSSVTKAVSAGFRVFHSTLDGQRLAISGVNLDEEAIQLITFQRTYQAAARYIATVNELLNMLVSL
jgi:flagellar hook-associated protein 1 FlgK